MRILLDTQYLLWALDRPGRLPDAARNALEDPGCGILFSAASIWEIAIKAALRRDDFNGRADRIAEAARMTGFTALPVTDSHAAAVAGLPFHHRDPFDRLLIAQARAEPARLLTADAILARYTDLVWHLPA